MGLTSLPRSVIHCLAVSDALDEPFLVILRPATNEAIEGGPGALDFSFVDEMVQLFEIDSSPEPACLRLNSKSRHAPYRGCVRRQPMAQRLGDHFFERSATVSGGLPKYLRDIVIEGESRSHPYIMMRHKKSVNVLGV